VADADAYFANLLSFDQWDGLGDEDTKARALITATAALDQLTFWGDAVTTTQALRFPRRYVGVSDGTTIPRPIVAATCEHALALATKAAAGLIGESDRMAMRAEGVLSWTMGNRSESLAPLASSSVEAALTQFSGPVQRFLQGWVRGGFQLDSGRRPQAPGGHYDAYGQWWPWELS